MLKEISIMIKSQLSSSNERICSAMSCGFWKINRNWIKKVVELASRLQNSS